MEAEVEQQKVQYTDRRAALLEAFDSANDDAQGDIVLMVQAIAASAPRRAPLVLRLVDGSCGNDGFR